MCLQESPETRGSAGFRPVEFTVRCVCHQVHNRVEYDNVAARGDQRGIQLQLAQNVISCVVGIKCDHHPLLAGDRVLHALERHRIN